MFGRPGKQGKGLSCEAKQDWTVNWLNKLGFSFGPENRVLTYAIAGITATDLRINRQSVQTFQPGAPFGQETITQQRSGNQTLVGVVLGAGIQYALNDRINLGAGVSSLGIRQRLYYHEGYGNQL